MDIRLNEACFDVIFDIWIEGGPHERLAVMSMKDFDCCVTDFHNKKLPYCLPIVSKSWIQHHLAPVETFAVVTGCILGPELRIPMINSRVLCETETPETIDFPAKKSIRKLRFEGVVDKSAILLHSPEKMTATDTRIDWAHEHVFGTCFSPSLSAMAQRKSPLLIQEARRHSIWVKRVQLWLETR